MDYDDAFDWACDNIQEFGNIDLPEVKMIANFIVDGGEADIEVIANHFGWR